MTDARSLTRELVAIESINPDLDPTGSGERNIARFAADWLRERGFVVEMVEALEPDEAFETDDSTETADGAEAVEPATAGRPSIIATRRGTGGGPALLINGHLDTVGVADYLGDPYMPGTGDDPTRIYGRGAYDMKSGLAAAMVAAAGAPQTEHDVILAFVADEEYGSVGTERVLETLHDRGITVGGAIVVEPTGLDISIAHRGFAWFDLRLEGAPAHGSQPHLGVDAIAAATDVLIALRTLDGDLQQRTHPLVPRSNVRVSTIDGGTDAATIAPTCRLTIERRTIPGEHAGLVGSELRAAIAAVTDAHTGIRWSLTEIVSRAAFEIAPTHPLVACVSAALETAGVTPELRGDPWWTDAALFDEAGIPVVLIGVDGAGAHAPEEWVDADSIDTLERVLTQTIVTFADQNGS